MTRLGLIEMMREKDWLGWFGKREEELRRGESVVDCNFALGSEEPSLRVGM